MRQTTQPDTLSRYILAVLCGIGVATAGLLIGYGSIYLKSWSLVIIEQEMDGSEAVNVPGRDQCREPARERAFEHDPE